MDAPREGGDIVTFTGDWTGQLVATSVLAGHLLRPEIEEVMTLDEEVRRREEDPFTGRDVATTQPPRLGARTPAETRAPRRDD